MDSKNLKYIFLLLVLILDYGCLRDSPVVGKRSVFCSHADQGFEGARTSGMKNQLIYVFSFLNLKVVAFRGIVTLANTVMHVSRNSFNS